MDFLQILNLFIYLTAVPFTQINAFDQIIFTKENSMDCNQMKNNKNKRQNLAAKIVMFKFVKYKKYYFTAIIFQIERY